MNIKNICPVCGFSNLKNPAYDEYGYGSHEICGCCMFEFGYDDSSKKYTFELYRNNWIKNGFNFFRKADQPKDWGEEKMKEQLKNIHKVNFKPRLL